MAAIRSIQSHEGTDLEVIPVSALGVDEKYVPEGWPDQRTFLDHIVTQFDADILYDEDNREWALDDLKFAAGDQWDPEVKRMREAQFRPCMMVNVLPQFIGQVIGDRRINKTQIKVSPMRDGTKEVAEIRSGLIKSIELYSRAERVYDLTCEDQVTCGIGNMRVDMEWTANDVFDQDLFIRHIPNPLAVVWDRMSVDPTGRDARHCFVRDSMPRDVFEKNFPDIDIPVSSGFGGFGATYETSMRTRWLEGNVVHLVEYWEMIEKPAEFCLLQDGKVIDCTDLDLNDPMYQAILWRDPKTGQPKTRKSSRTYARMHIVTSFAILSEAYELPLDRLPIIRVEGRTIRVGEERVRFGLVRFAKDSQRLKNYWRSVAAETLALQPKAQWIADAEAVKGREKDFRESHLTGDPLLIFNKGQTAPERVDPPVYPAALSQEAQFNQQDIKDTTGIQDASLGIASNEVSGKAINARQREGDVATVTFHDNLNSGIQEVGCVLDQLIPICYDTVRTIRVIGADDKHLMSVINDPTDPDSIDITQGKYDVVVETGPSFTTQRQEALDGMMTLLQTAPEMMMVIGDKVAENTDWPGSSGIADRIRKFIAMQTPQVLDPDELPPPPPPPAPGSPQAQQMQQQQAVQQTQLAEAQAQLQHAENMRQIELQEAQAKTVMAQAQAQKAQADAEKAQHDARRADTMSNIEPIKHLVTLGHADEKHEQGLAIAGTRHVQQLSHAEDTHAQGFVHKEATGRQQLQHNERNQRVKTVQAEQQMQHNERGMKAKEKQASQSANKKPQGSPAGKPKGK